YNGGEAVYNPFDLLPALLRMESSAELLSAFEVGTISTEALMFQSGYLTLAGEKKRGKSRRCRFALFI
ncbi:MAG: hypothetical protein LBP86_04925, partial [Azoarcus sp.]|nr:hypothetical protein [Azoarcus sp.]